jgi:ABC-type transport system, ATP-binding protein
MPVIDQLVYLARLHGSSAKAAKTRAMNLLERLDLGHRAKDKLEELSLGNQQRAQVAAALVHKPSALVLDEPFSGLDPHAVDITLQVLQETADTGIPVLFSSHQLDVVERLCDVLVILADGHVVASGTRDELIEQHTDAEWELVTTAGTDWVHSITGVTITSADEGQVRFHADSVDVANEVLREATSRGPIHSFGPVHHSLHEIFTEVTR